MAPHEVHLAISSLGQAIACVGIGLAIGGALWWWEAQGDEANDQPNTGDEL